MRGKHRPSLVGVPPLCACGCGASVVRAGGENRWRTWLKGHHTRKWGFDTKEAKVFERLSREYGLSRQTYEAMVARQGDKCAICRTSDKGALKGVPRSMWAVDHDHDTNVVRGLLCHGCNAALGLFNDSPELLRRAIKYVQQRSLLCA